MRLIDADKIRYTDLSDGRVPGGIWYTPIKEIKKQPTVDAIPIEWIKNYGYEWADREVVICNGIKYSIVKDVTDTMLKRWRKERKEE